MRVAKAVKKKKKELEKIKAYVNKKKKNHIKQK